MTGQAAVNNKGFLEISPSEKGVTSTSHWNDCATPAPNELLHEEGAGFKGAHRIDLFSENTTMGSQSHSPTTPTEDSSISMTTIDASNSPLIIPYDASLSEGLRLLIMHHLHGCNIDTDSLSANELSLLQCHLPRLAQSAQKIINSLSVGASVGVLSSCPSRSRAPCAVCDEVDLHSKISGDTLPNRMQASSQDCFGLTESRRNQCKSLKLTEDEIMKLYTAAQDEAAREADWRGVQWQGDDGTVTGSKCPSSLPRTDDKHRSDPLETYESSFFHVIGCVFEPTSRSPSCVAAQFTKNAFF